MPATVPGYARARIQHTKRRDAGTIPIFRLGDFCEIYGDDAKVAADILGNTVTKRSGGVLVTGFPYAARDFYIQRILDAGYRVALWESADGTSV